MPTLVLAARKGGVGKTTLSASFAVAAALAETTSGPAVALIDLDPQGTLTAWHNHRTDEAPLLAQIPPSQLGTGIRALKAQGVGTVILDTPPGHGDIVVAAMAVADLVIIPVKPGEHDFDAALATAAIAESLGRPLVCIPNDATFRSIAMGKTIAGLKEAGLPATPAIHHRVDILLAGGRTVTERAPTSKAAAELRAAWAIITHRAQAVSA